MKILDTFDLAYRDGSSDKVYHSAIYEHENGLCSVAFAYGRRGSTLVRGTKTSSPVPYQKASAIYQKLYDEKFSKGYRPAAGVSGSVFEGEIATSGNGESSVDLSAIEQQQKEDTGVRCQLLNAIDEDEVECLINDPAWGAQEKKDGDRRMVRYDGKKIIFINRKGQKVDTSPAISAAIKAIGRPMLIDGEAIGDTLYAFGLLELDGKDLRQKPYIESYALLMRVLKGFTGDGLQLVVMEASTEGKRALYEQLKAGNKEGIVFKRLSAPHTDNRPNSGGDHLKFKFYATASVIVLNVNDKRSVKMGMIYAENPAKTVFVGNVTIPANCNIPKPGDVIEVRYLYAFTGGSLFQPTYLGVRDDIDRAACTDAQLKYKAVDQEEEAA